MRNEYRSWSGSARTMALGVDAAVAASQAGDADEFDEAITALGRVDREQLGTLLGAVTQALLERAHSDGLDSDDAQDAVERCSQAAAWYPKLERDYVIRALLGALGVPEADADEDEPVDESKVVVHGLLLISDLLTVSAAELPPLVDDALGELMRAQTMEMP